MVTMKICEGCIKQDTCKFKNEVELYEEGLNEPTPDAPKNPLIWPLEVTLSCRYKQEGCYPYIPTTSTYTPDPNVPWSWTATDVPCDVATDIKTYTS